MNDARARPQFSIASLIGLTAVLAPAIAAFRFDEWTPVIPSVMPVAILCLIVLKSGPRCLLGAVVGALLLLGFFVVLFWIVEGSAVDPWHAWLLVAYFGAAIGGGFHAARIERRVKLESAGVEAPGVFSGWFRMVVFILLGAFLGAVIGLCVTSQLPSESPADAEIVMLLNLLAAIIGGLSAGFVAVILSRLRKPDVN